jgi:putative membrane protein
VWHTAAKCIYASLAEEHLGRKGIVNIMIQLIVRWIISAVLLLVVSRLVPGFEVDGLRSALIAALVIGLVNATLGFFLKIVTFPLTLVSLGLFLLVINALMLLFASHFVRGFIVHGFVPAFWGALLLSLLGMVTRWLTASGD